MDLGRYEFVTEEGVTVGHFEVCGNVPSWENKWFFC